MAPLPTWGEKYLLEIMLLETAVSLLRLRALFVICARCLWALFSLIIFWVPSFIMPRASITTGNYYYNNHYYNCHYYYHYYFYYYYYHYQQFICCWGNNNFHKQCKANSRQRNEAAWKWEKEYLQYLREKYNIVNKTKEMKICGNHDQFFHYPGISPSFTFLFTVS